MVEYYDRNRHLIVDGLNEINGFSCLYPKGAFYVFPNITDFGMSSVETAEYILEKTHVVTSPGSAFGPAGEGYIRICYASKYDTVEVGMNKNLCFVLLFLPFSSLLLMEKTNIKNLI